jgi:hypothetical protein
MGNPGSLKRVAGERDPGVWEVCLEGGIYDNRHRTGKHDINDFTKYFN